MLVLTLLIGLGGYSQNKLTGVIIDEESGRPVPDAYILLSNGIGVASDSVGLFSIMVNNMPVTLRITHVSYGQSDIRIEQWPDGMLVIRIQRMISKLEEVQISAERMRILTEKDDFSLQDFAIDSTHLWMLGYINNRPKYGRLWIANLFGDTLHSIPVKKPEKLYKDVFGNIHLFFEDSVFQLYGTPDTIGLFAGMSRNEFRRIFYPIKGYYAGKLIYQNYLPRQEGLHTYYYSLSDSIPKFLTCIRDTTGEILQEDEYVYGRCARVITGLMNSSGTGGLKMWLKMMERKEKANTLVYRRIFAPLVGARDKLYVLNLYQDSLLVYDTSGAFVNSISVSFHKNFTFMKGIDYIDFDFLYDPGTDKVFCLERENTGWMLCEMNTYSGTLEKIPLPDFP